MARSKTILYAYSLALIFLMSLLGEILHRYIDPVNLVMLYLITVVIAATLWGKGPSVMTALVSVLVFDFLFVPPRFSFTVDDTQYLITFAGLLIAGLIISEFSSKIREHSLESAKRKTQDELQKTLLNSISHDLKTPLSSITGALSSLAMDNGNMSDLDKEKLTMTAYSQSLGLNRLVGNLLDITRIEAGALKLMPGVTDVRDLISLALESLKEKTTGRNIDITISHGVNYIPADISLMVKVFVNIIDNALKYSPPGSGLAITAGMAGSTVRICVKDKGIGIARQDIPFVFDKFYRAVNPHNVQGTGLGLSICKGIVEAHGGRIWVTSENRNGTEITVELPAHEKDVK